MQWGQQQQATAAWGQQQQGYGNGYAQQAQQQQANTKDVILNVTGCTHATVGGIVRGSFQLAGENHGKPAYKKDGQVNGLDVMTYYWDERDGPGFCGWWFGPKVGGDQVWAYHTDKNSPLPPQTGWKVPYDGPVDQTLVIAYKPKGQQQAQAQPQQQAWGQQQGGYQQQQMQQQQMQQQQMMQQQKAQEQQRLEAQRKQLEDLKKKQMADSQMQANQMRQQQMAQQQARMEENKMKLAQANAQRAEEQKNKMEAMKAQQAEIIRKRAEEQKRKEEELQAKKLEQIAVLNVRRVLQTYRASNAENHDVKKQELDAAVAKEMEALGSQKERIMQEVEQAVKTTKDRLEKVLEMKKQKMEQVQKAQGLVGQLEKLVEKAEASSKGVAEEVEPFFGDKDMKLNEIDACASAVEEAAKEANEQVKACGEFVAKEQSNIKNIPVIPGEPAPTCVVDMNKLVMRVNEAKKAIAQAVAKCSSGKTLRTKKAHAKAKYDKSLAAFKKFDSDKDGKLSRREIQAFSKGEYGFTIPIETLDNICNVLIKADSKGVEKADFHRVKIMIGVAREAAIDSKRKADKEAREKMLENLKEKLKASVEKTGEIVKEAGEAVGKAEKAVGALNSGKSKTSAEMVALANETDSVVEDTKKSLTVAKDAITKLNSETEPELKGFLTGEVRKLQGQLSPLEARCTKAAGTAAKFRADAVKKNTAELEKLKTTALGMIFHHQGAKKLLSKGLYDIFDKKKKGKVEESPFVSFFKTCAMKDEDDDRIGEEDASRLFAYLDTDENGFIPKDQFCNLIRRFMKVVKASVITDDISTKSKPVRRLNEGEVLECLSGPTDAEGEEVSRLKVKTMTDDVEGWVTPVGNRGTVFIEDGGNMFKVVKETILTGSFVIGEDTKTKDRKLKVGEICEAREWARKEEGSGLMRMKVALKSDGQVGWVTSTGNTGITFLEVM